MSEIYLWNWNESRHFQRPLSMNVTRTETPSEMKLDFSRCPLLFDGMIVVESPVAERLGQRMENALRPMRSKTEWPYRYPSGCPVRSGNPRAQVPWWEIHPCVDSSRCCSLWSRLVAREWVVKDHLAVLTESREESDHFHSRSPLADNVGEETLVDRGNVLANWRAWARTKNVFDCSSCLSDVLDPCGPIACADDRPVDVEFAVSE